MRYVVLGAGAVGGTIGARLADAGREVVLVARGAHAAAIREHGLRVAMPDCVLHVRVPLHEQVADLDLAPDDVVLLTTKTQDTTAVLSDLAGAAAAAGVDPPIVCVQNGVANERLALRRFSTVYGVVVMLPAVLLEPGRIDAQGAPYSGLLDIGRVPAGVDELAAAIAADFATSGFVAQPTPDIMRWKYAKLLRNVGNAVEALCGHDIDAAGRSAVQELDAAARAEAENCFVAAGIDWVRDDEWKTRRGDQVQHRPVEGRSRLGGSSWQSLARGTGSIEADYLNGEIVLLGRLHGVPTPVNEMLQREANHAARVGAAAGSLQPQQLLEKVR